MNKPNNPPAFPCETWTKVENGNRHQRHDGLSMRDYFAAKAMGAQLSIEGMEGCDKVIIAAMAYAMSDAMLAEREKHEN